MKAGIGATFFGDASPIWNMGREESAGGLWAVSGGEPM